MFRIELHLVRRLSRHLAQRRTLRLIESLPAEIRKDIGWRAAAGCDHC